MKKLLTLLYDYVIITLGCLLFALGLTVFIYPNNISPGGVSGISALINHYFDFVPIGVCIVAINLPLVVVGFLKFRFSFIIKTAYAVLVSSTMIDVLSNVLPKFGVERLLSSLAAGVFVGTGLGVIMLKGGTTGGTDIIAKLVNLKFEFLSLGRLVLAVDAIIVSLSAYVYRDFESLLYSLLFLFVSAVVIDKLIYGANVGKIVYIITDSHKEVTNEIYSQLGRGVTYINSVGSYTGKSQNMLMCVVRGYEVSKLIKIAKLIDSKAFLVVSDAGEILGQGFKNLV